MCFLYKGDYQSPDTKPFLPLLLAHAKIYALAHYKDVKPLKALALHRLKAALVDNAIEPEAIVELVRYVYLNTDSLRTGEEPMRRMVLYFVASNRVLESSEMKLLLSEEGGLSREFVIEIKFYEQMVKKEDAQVGLEATRRELLALREKVRSLDQERAMEKATRESFQASFSSSQQEVTTLTAEIRLLGAEVARQKRKGGKGYP